jgi:hypothetical protein
MPALDVQPGDVGSSPTNSSAPSTPVPVTPVASGSTPSTTLPAGAPDPAAPNAPWSVGQFLLNALKSVPEADYNAVNGIVLHPINTLNNLSDMIAGAFKPNVAEAPAPGQEGQTVGSTPVQAFNQFGANFLGGALQGNLKGALTKAYQDPAGFLLDMSQLVDAVPGGSEASDAINPVTQSTSVAGKVMDKAGGVIEAPFSGSVNQEAIDAANKIGIQSKDLPLATKTTSPFLKVLTAGASQMMGGGAIESALETARGNVNDFISNTIQKITPEVMDNENLGNLLKTGLNNFKDNFEADKDTLYDNFSSTAKNIPAFTNNTVSTLQNIISQEGASLAGNTTGFFQKMLDKFTGADGEIPGGATINGQAVPTTLMKKIIQQAGLNPDLVFENLKQTRTDIGQMLKNNVDPFSVGNYARLDDVYGALAQDMHATVGAIDPGLSDELKNVDDFYSSGVNKINSKLGDLITNADPEKIIGNFIKPNSVTVLNNLRDVVDPATMNMVGASFIKNLITKATDADGVFNIQKFKNAYSSFDAPTLNALLTPEAGANLADAVDKLGTAQDLLKTLKSYAGSATTPMAKALAVVGKVAELGPAAFGLGSGNFMLALQGIVGATTWETLFPKFMASKFASQWLSDGFDTKVGQMVQKVAPEVGRSAMIANMSQNSQPQATSTPQSTPNAPTNGPQPTLDVQPGDVGAPAPAANTGQ